MPRILKRHSESDDIMFRRGMTREDYQVQRTSMYEFRHRPIALIDRFVEHGLAALRLPLSELGGTDVQKEYFLSEESSLRVSSFRLMSQRMLNLYKEDLRTGLMAMYPLKRHHMKDASDTLTSISSIPTDSENLSGPSTSEKKRDRDNSPELEADILEEDIQDRPSTSEQADKKESRFSKFKKILMLKKKKK